MSGRAQPEHGADSAEALAEYEVRKCDACSLPALPNDTVCAGHARLFEYTDHERSGGIAANE